MIPKSRDLKDPTNYRPIAILSIFYKIFSRMLYNRLLPILDPEQSYDQFGFRRNIRLEDALICIEGMLGKCNEFQLPLWIASLDLKKAFDRIKFSTLFIALREQAIADPELALLQSLNSDQIGFISKDCSFPILRGVRQGDVISSLLFNAVLELICRR